MGPSMEGFIPWASSGSALRLGSDHCWGVFAVYTDQTHSAFRSSHQRGRGFTLIESLVAAAILAGIMLAVTAAVTAAQQNALEAQKRIAAALAAEELMSRLCGFAHADLPICHGYREEVGEMVDGSGQPLPASHAMIGREVEVVPRSETLPIPAIRVDGVEIRVIAFDNTNRVIADVARFVPDPNP